MQKKKKNPKKRQLIFDIRIIIIVLGLSQNQPWPKKWCIVYFEKVTNLLTVSVYVPDGCYLRMWTLY